MTVQWNEESVKLLREGRVFWDESEGGAPMIALPEGSPEDSRKLVEIACLFGSLPVGTYSYSRPSSELYGHAPLVTKLDSPVEFEVTSEHLTLLRHLVTRFQVTTDEGDVLVGFDSKRPYGDYSYFQAEMALHLGLPTSSNEKGQTQIDSATEQRMNRLHEEMEIVVQIFLQHFALEPASYRDLKYGAWERE